MSIIDGVAEEALEDFGEDFEDGVLTVPGEQTSDGQGGWTHSATEQHNCKALLTDYSDHRRLAPGIPKSDRLVLVLGASLPQGVIPGEGHTITVPDPSNGMVMRTLDVVGKTGDPAAALYKLQAR